MKILRLLSSIVGLALLVNGSSSAANTELVRISTNHGDIDVLLYSEKAPLSVSNFLAYVDNGHYNGTIYHRVIDNFMIQGGGFTPKFEKKKTGPAIPNEAYNGLKNDIGTLAMARTGDPHSATAQFFINVNNNSFLNFDTAPYGPLNTLRQSQLGIQDKKTGRIATTNCRGQRITRNSLGNAASAKAGDNNSYECLMQAILSDPGYTIDRELSACLSQIDQLKKDKKLGADATCSDYVNQRHQGIKLIHVYWGYAVFGKVVRGMEIVNKIKSMQTGSKGPFSRNAPLEDVIINSIQRIQQETAG